MCFEAHKTPAENSTFSHRNPLGFGNWKSRSSAGKPFDFIDSFQREHGLRDPGVEPALHFLDLLEVPRPQVYHNLLDHLKGVDQGRYQSLIETLGLRR